MIHAKNDLKLVRGSSEVEEPMMKKASGDANRCPSATKLAKPCPSPAADATELLNRFFVLITRGNVTVKSVFLNCSTQKYTMTRQTQALIENNTIRNNSTTVTKLSDVTI